MRFEWDQAKRLANVCKHGIDFIGCETVFDGYTVTIEDQSMEYGERRFLTLGLLQGRVVLIVHTESEEVIRIISVRKATKREQAFYFQSLPH